MGLIDRPIRFIQPASSIVFSLDKPILLEWAGQKLETSNFLLPPSTPILGNSQGSPIAICMLDPLGYDHYSMSRLMRNKRDIVFFDIEDESSYIESFNNFYHRDMPIDEVYQKLEALLCRGGYEGKIVDPRISTIIEMIHETVEQNVSVDEIAKSINVSTSRLFKLFKEEIGAPIRRYRLWHRLFVATCVMAKSHNLTESAHAAGFSDIAHFHRTFKRMLGLTPSELLAQEQGLNIFTKHQ